MIKQETWKATHSKTHIAQTMLLKQLPEPQPEPQPATSPPTQNTGNSGSGGSGGSSGGGSGGYYSANTKVLSIAEPKKESEIVASAVDTEKKEKIENNTVAMTIAESVQEKQTNPLQEIVPVVLPAENENPAGFAVLAQNVLNAVIVIVAGAIALFGKLFFK